MGMGWIDDAAYVLGSELSVAQTLGTGMRTSVARCWVDGSTTATGGARTVIAKCFHSKAMSHNSGGLGIVREIAGLRSLANAPLCYAADQDLGVVVMEDVPGTSLGTILAGNDPSAALAAAEMWGRATATVMAASKQETPDRPTCDSNDAELEMFATLRGGEAAEVVTQADPRPGNVLITDHARFVDYEAASVHHPAVDVVNLVMPWASCDGLVGVPAEFVAAVRDGFLAGSRHAGSWLANEPMIGLAGTAATLQLTELSLDSLRRDRRNQRSGMARSAMVYRWSWTAAHGTLTPIIADLCGRMAQRAVRSWGWPEHLSVAHCFSPENLRCQGRPM
ncbi:MAG: hypothetical protein DI600_00225 [Cutibacterium granulosum]|nr:MAG: hypothetical protein DI600_00225 [Cutibacterium granulosum]